LKILVGVALVLAQAMLVVAQQAPVPVEQEPHHHVVLQNDSVIVMHVTIAPGDVSFYHTHSRDRVSVHLTDGLVTLQPINEAESEPLPAKVGEISSSTMDKPVTHRVRNVGAVPFEIMDVEILKNSGQPSEAVAAVAAENPSARVYKWVLAPGSSSEPHTHTRPYLIMAVTPFKLTMTTPDGKSLTHEIKPGDVHWVDAKVTHTLTNSGTTEGQIVEIELK
jgi:quercetin dioxygenase-like cupin family protein